MEAKKKLSLWRSGAKVERAHTVPHVGSYSVGEHAHGVASLILLAHPNPSVNLLRAAITHDLHEYLVGDLPSFVKNDAFRDKELDAMRSISTTTDLSDHEELWLLAADRAELLLWCQDQRSMGNRKVNNIFKHVVDWFKKNPVPEELYDLIKDYNGSNEMPFDALLDFQDE